MKKLLFIAMLSALPALAQPSNPSIVLVGTAPSGSCSVNLPDQQVVTTGALYSCQNGTWAKFGTGTGSGSVTSVTFTGDGTVLSSTPSAAVTTSGTLAATLANVADNVFLAGPASGPAAAPTYRAVNLASADVSGILPIANGGTGASTPNHGTLIYSTNAVSSPANGVNNWFRSGSTSAGTSDCSASTSNGGGTPVPATGTATGFYFTNTVAASAANSYAVTWVLDGTNTALTCTYTGTSTFSCHDSGHTVAVTAGQNSCVQITCTGTCAASSVGAAAASVQY